MTDGKNLENLVSFVEKTLLPDGFEVKQNERVFNDAGQQIAEFDIEIHGKVGSTSISWLIECRDRPGSGVAPVSWIEQLVGRRDRFGFNKVTAVSTTGFAAGALDFAESRGIELREVTAVTPDEFQWIKFEEMNFVKKVQHLSSARIVIDDNESAEVRNALKEVLKKSTHETRFLRSINNSSKITILDAFVGAVRDAGTLFEDLEENGHGKKVHIRAKYSDGDYFVVETEAGELRVRAIEFKGELRLERTGIPIIKASRYEKTEDAGVISQLVEFAPVDTPAGRFSLEFHRMGEDGETHVLLRPVSDSD